jgi:hypothetical protein
MLVWDFRRGIDQPLHVNVLHYMTTVELLAGRFGWLGNHAVPS